VKTPAVQAVQMLEGRLGRTGEVIEVRTRLLQTLLENGITPVISPVSRGPDGGALNVNADDAAAAVAGAMKAARFLLVSNVPGVLQGGATLPQVTTAELEKLISEGVASGGMVPKLRAGMRAAETGVADVRIGDLSLFSVRDSGTRIVP
jgi:acetylglutamate kinase